MTIFVSYTTRDGYVDRNTLKMVSDVLSKYGSHYIDLLHNDASEKQRHVEEMLSHAQLMILIKSRSIEKSEWVQWELNEAKKICIPIIEVQASINPTETISNLQYKLVSEFKKLTRRSSKDALTRAA
jgi:hypothetical protein